MHKKTNLIIKIVLFAIFTNALPISRGYAQSNNEKINKQNVYSDIAQHYLPVFNITEKQSVVQTDDEKIKKPDLTLNTLSPGEQRKIAFEILSNHGEKSCRFDTKIFDADFWKDLELFCGPIKRRKAHLAQTWKKTITSIGDAVSKRILVRPTTDIPTLKKRQAAIKKLQTNKELADSLKKHLYRFAKQEQILYSFWESENPANKKFINDLYFQGKLFSQTLNTNPLALEALIRTTNLGTVQSILSPFIYTWLWATLGYWISNKDSLLYSTFVGAPWSLCKSVEGIYEMYRAADQATQGNRVAKDAFRTTKIAIFLVILITAAVYGFGAYKLARAEKQRIDLEKYLQTKLIAVSSAIRRLYSIFEKAIKHKELRAAIPALNNIDKLQTSTLELTEFLKTILTNTFTGKASFFSLTGRVLAANKLIEKVKNHLVKAFEALGEVDAYLAMADLLNEFEAKEARFSFVDFVENDNTLLSNNKPYLEVEGFWLPQLLHNKKIKSGEHSIVVNSLKMDTEPGGTRNIILTGPNTAGKSTIIKALIVSLVLAQSYGIAPTQAMKFTPFSKIQTYINIPDNAAEGISLFKAELLRVSHLLNNIQSLKPNEYSFTILDEIFNGTSPEEAIIGSGNVMETLAQLPNSMNIIATHYGLLTRVEEYTGGIFKNYKVTVNEHPNGDLTFPYTIEHGRSDQHIALSLIKKEGLLSDVGKFNLSQRLADDIAEGGIR